MSDELLKAEIAKLKAEVAEAKARGTTPAATTQATPAAPAAKTYAPPTPGNDPNQMDPQVFRSLTHEQQRAILHAYQATSGRVNPYRSRNRPGGGR